MKIYKFILAIALVAITSCQSDSPPERSLDQYTAESELLSNVCLKFLNERNAERLHNAALAIQLSHSVSCTNYNGQCEAFSDFLTEAINLTADNKFAAFSQFKLRKKYDELKIVIEEGKKKLMSSSAP